MAATVMYVDTDGSGASSPFNSWATAAQTLEAAMEDAACDAGSVIYMQGATSDPGAATLSSEGTNLDPVKVIGCVDGTTNEGSSLVEADFTNRHDGGMPLIARTGSMSIAGRIHFYGIEFTSTGNIGHNSDADTVFSYCKLVTSASATFNASGNPSSSMFIDCEMNAYVFNGQQISAVGGKVTGRASWCFGATITQMDGVDLSGCTSLPLHSGTYNVNFMWIRNCKLKASYTLFNTDPNGHRHGYRSYGLVVGSSSDTGAKTNSDSFQNYEYQDPHGTIDNEATVVRTGGADDQASGAHSLLMVNGANDVNIASDVALVGPWMRVWVVGGSLPVTCTVYTTHDNAGTINRDLYDTELRVEFLTTDPGDEANHDYTSYPGYMNQYVTGSTTAAGTDDTGSTWATYNTYKRKFSHTFTPGFSGWCMARVRLSYDSATPVGVYVDPKIEVT